MLVMALMECEAFQSMRPFHRSFDVQMSTKDNKCEPLFNTMSIKRVFASGLVGISLLAGPVTVLADADNSAINKVPLLTKRTSDVQQYADVGRGFKLLRPFGFNEFDGAGGGYAVKFASLFDVDENVVIGSSPSSADKTSITDYGSIEKLGEKLAAKRGGTVVSSRARETDGVVFYEFQFENPLDQSLPRTGPKDNRPTKGIELYQLCVAKGRLWSVQATSNDKLFPTHEKTLRIALASFYPRL